MTLVIVRLPRVGEPPLPPPATTPSRELDAARQAERIAEIRARLAASEAAAAARQAANRRICERCPSGLWRPAGEYCQQVFNTCKCGSPKTRAPEKTATAQRAGTCPMQHFPQEELS